MIDPLTWEQEIHDTSDPVFEGVDLPGNGIINIYDETIFRTSSIRKFENNENYEYGLAVTEVLEYIVPNFIATDGTGTTLDIETKEPVILRLTPRRTLFNLQANFSGNFGEGITVTASQLAQRVIGPRLYFADGMHDHGIFNLNDLGQSLFLNAVGEHVAPTVDPGPVSIWPGTPGDREVGIGWINDAAYPLIYHYGANIYLEILPGATLESMYAYNATQQYYIWTTNLWGGWYYRYENQSGATSGWFNLNF
jgi:hypothetical protein